MKFQSGQSGNPAGRPPGSLNKKTIALEEAFAEHAQEVLQEVIARAKDGENAAMRLCMDRMLAPRRERTVAIDLPVIESPADARKAMAIVTAEVSGGNITITEATRLIGLIQRMLRLAGQIVKMEQADREATEAMLAPAERPEARPNATQTGGPADRSLYFPVNSENAEGAGEAGRDGKEARAQTGGPADPSLYFPVNSENAEGEAGGAASDSAAGLEPSARPPLAQAA